MKKKKLRQKMFNNSNMDSRLRGNDRGGGLEIGNWDLKIVWKLKIGLPADAGRGQGNWKFKPLDVIIKTLILLYKLSTLQTL